MSTISNTALVLILSKPQKTKIISILHTGNSDDQSLKVLVALVQDAVASDGTVPPRKAIPGNLHHIHSKGTAKLVCL